MNLGPITLGLSDALVVTNCLSTCVLGWLAWRSERRVARADDRADHWERVARSVAQRAKQDTSKTIVAPAWHAPRTSTPGQRLASLVHTSADFRVEADD